MKTRDFSFDLPDDLIAQEPPSERGTSRLMVLDPSAGAWSHRRFTDLVDLIEPGTLMVFNDSKVRRARVFATTAGGGRVETVFLQPFPHGRWECLVSKSKKLRLNQVLEFPLGTRGVIESPEGATRIIRFEPPVDETYLEKNGHLPLPPYIKRPDNAQDENRYQTVYAQDLGSAAAPTAGLHFTPQIMQSLEKQGVELCRVTLHVGLGTFLPVRTEEVHDHRMHREIFRITDETSNQLNKAKSDGRKILAVGTTALRTLESAWSQTGFPAGEGSTDIFITPGYQFRAVDQLFTNFHTPESTLLMLVSAFAGKDLTLKAYTEAVKERYRFFSYGDAMFIPNRV